MSITKESKSALLRLLYAAVCLALCMVLPFLTGQIPQVGKALCPMHLPVLLCGFLCPWPYALAVGAIAPLLRSGLFGMPVFFPEAVVMSAELACYGLCASILYRALPKRAGYVYVALLGAMLAGRLVGGLVKWLLLGLGLLGEYSFAVFVASYFTNSIPGIISHIVLIPVLVLALRRGGLIPDETISPS